MNRTESGVIEEAGTVLRNPERLGYLVRLDNGKQVIVLDESILE